MSVSYQKIKLEVEKRGSQLRMFIPENAEMSVQGFKLAVDNGTLKVSTLEHISKALKIPMSYWFQEEDRLIQGEAELAYGENSAVIIKRLNALVEDLMDDKARLKRENDELRDKLGLGKVGS
jgi:hypothetical protein